MADIINDTIGMELKIKELKKVKIDEENWITYYIDERTSEKWIKEYPDSSYHGGGAPVLTKIEKFPWE